ncbi:leucyl aminopeptidase [Vampirovibrio sp.]|uniref:leucyl aminopeptidase n=1 Tax=Vampirovibrio sp. TaxID=2717857 RepID=UPI003593C0D1
MQIEVAQGDISQFKAEAIIVNWVEGAATPAGATASVDKALGGLLTRELQTLPQVFKGKLGETCVLPTYGQLVARYVVVVGLGSVEALNALQLRRASAAAIRACGKLKVKQVASLLHGSDLNGSDLQGAGGAENSPERLARLLAEGALLGDYQFMLRKGKKTAESQKESAGNEDEELGGHGLETLTIVAPQAEQLKAIELGLGLGRMIGVHTNLARDWVNDSANYVTPTFLKTQAQALQGVTCEVLDFDQIRKLGMGAFELVAKGSDEPPYLIHLCYKPSGKASKKVALVGKGVTFDSGGLSLKPPASMELMKMDMAGAAAVLATLKAISEFKNLDVEVHGFIATCENMPSARSSKPGDVVTAMSGKTIEVNNTDAEGRLILCDALTYAQQQTDPDELLDLATLTGACVTALGKVAAGIMGTSDDLINRVRAAGEQAGEKLWQLPLYEEYQSFLKSDIADLINSGSKGQAGSSAGGMFLKAFVDKNRAWAHLDIAGPAWVTSDVPETPKGGTGFGVRTLLYYLYNLN